MNRMIAVLSLGLGLAAPAMAQDTDERDGAVALCLAQDRAEAVCECAADRLRDEIGGNYDTYEELGRVYAAKREEGMGLATAWEAALDEMGLGLVQTNPMGQAHRDAIDACAA